MTSRTPPPYVFDVVLTHAVIVRLMAYSVLLFWMTFELFGPTALSAVPAMRASTPLAGGLVFVVTLTLHEWVHGASMRLFGAKPQYGVAVAQRILPVAYTTAPGHRFTLRQMMVVALAPFVVLSAVTLLVAIVVPSIRFYAFIAFVSNLTGAVGDLWMASVVWRFRRCRDVHIVDQKSGLSVESTDLDSLVVAEDVRAAGACVTRLALGSLGALAMIVWTGLPIAEYFTAVGAVEIRVGPAWFPLLEYSQEDEVISIYYRHLVVASIIMGLPWMFGGRQRRPTEPRSERKHPPGVPALI